MSKIIFTLFLSFVCTFAAAGQATTFSDPNVEYTFDVPDAIWKSVVKPSASNPNVEYAYGDRLDGHLEIRKFTMRQGEVVSDMVERDKEQRLQFIVGYVAGKEENFAGLLRGKIYNYEFVRFGENDVGPGLLSRR
jgi:hypothetical protein